MSPFAVLDQAILDRLKKGPARFYVLEVDPAIVAEAKRLSDGSNRERFRIIDGRLTSLRKAGKIVPGRLVGWSLATPTPLAQDAGSLVDGGKA